MRAAGVSEPPAFSLVGSQVSSFPLAPRKETEMLYKNIEKACQIAEMSNGVNITLKPEELRDLLDDNRLLENLLNDGAKFIAKYAEEHDSKIAYRLLKKIDERLY